MISGTDFSSLITGLFKGLGFDYYPAAEHQPSARWYVTPGVRVKVEGKVENEKRIKAHL